MRDKKLRQEILTLESEVRELEKTLGAIRQRLLDLKDLARDRQNKKESSSMYKVLKEDKTHTMAKSELGNIKVDEDFMEKEVTKHLDNPDSRDMVAAKEMLSFPKVAKDVKVEFNSQYQSYAWKVKANDGNVIHYGEREYKIDGKNTRRLLITYSETEKGQREVEKAGVGERGHSHRQINDPDFLRPADEIISQKIDETVKKQKASIEQILQKQEGIPSIPRVEKFSKEGDGQEIIKHTPKQRIKK